MALIAISASLERVKRVAQLVADSDHAPATGGLCVPASAFGRATSRP